MWKSINKNSTGMVYKTQLFIDFFLYTFFFAMKNKNAPNAKLIYKPMKFLSILGLNSKILLVINNRVI